MAVSKSSMAIDSFLEYFKDAKPYHTKLLEIIEEYNFSEDMYVIMSDSMEADITIENEPLCKLTGFGIDYDDECGYDAIDCCDLFDCTGGYGYIFDNSDLLVEETIIDKDNDEGKLIVSGNQLADTRIPVTSVYNSTNFILEGDATALLDVHSIGIFVNVLQFDVVSNDDTTVRIAGNYKNFLDTKTNFRIEGTETEYNGTFTILTSSYDVGNDETVIRFSFFKPVPDNALTGLKIQIRNSNPNGGIYQIESYSFNGTETNVTIVNDTFSNINPDELRLGSFQFRTGLRYPREIEVDTSAVPYHNILFSDYDYNNNRTQIYVDEDISSYVVGSDTVKLYGYFFGPGYDGNEECTKPKDTHVYSKLEENLLIEIDDSLITPPSPNFVMFSNEANYRQLPIYETTNFEEEYRLDVREYYLEDNQSVSAAFDAPDGNSFLHSAYFYVNTSGDGSKLALYDYGPPYVTIFDMSTLEPITPNLNIDDFESNWHQTTGAINTDGSLLTAGGYRTSDGTFVERVYEFSGGTWTIIEEIADGDTDVWSTQNTFYFIKNDTEIIFPLSYSPSLSNTDAIFRVYDLNTSSFLNITDAVSPLDSDGNPVTWVDGFVLTDDEQYLLVSGPSVSGGRDIYVYETTNWTLHNTCVITDASSGNGSIVISSYDDNLYFENSSEIRYLALSDVINNSSTTSTLFNDDTYISNRLYISPDGKLLSATDISFDDLVRVYSIETGSLVKEFDPLDNELLIEHGGLFSNFTTSYEPSPNRISVDSSSNSYGLGVEWIGRLGTGRNGSYIGTPITIGRTTGSNSEWTKMAAGTNTTLGILSDGTLWGTGPTWDGTIAKEISGSQLTFSQIGTDTWSDIGISKDGQSSDTRDDVAHAAGIKTDGTLWAWGVSFNANYASDANEYIRTPVQLGTDTDWNTVSVGRDATNGGYVIKNDGSLWRWTDSDPVVVDNGSWNEVRAVSGSTALAIRGDGALFEITGGDSLSQIGTDTDWSDIDVIRGTRAYFGIKTDGTMYVWDINNSNDDFLSGLGVGTGTITSPTQIGTDTDWLTVSAGKHHVLALKTDGTLWGWGKNTGYALGDLGALGDIIETPTQIGTDTGFTDIDAGLWHNVILK